jgi:hypothetical protein
MTGLKSYNYMLDSNTNTYTAREQSISIEDLVLQEKKGLSFQEFTEVLSVIEEMRVAIATEEKVFNFPMRLKDVLQLFEIWKSKKRSLNIRTALACKKNSQNDFLVHRGVNDKKILEMRAAGLTLREIALSLHMSLSAVQRALSKNTTQRVIIY